MFMWNVEKCLDIFDEVYVSTDNHWIRETAENAGAKVIMRGEELCGDCPNIPVYQHALQFMNTESIVAVQANSPTIDRNIIALVKRNIEYGVSEVMTCHPDASIYGSVWAVSVDKLENYGDPYKPEPDILIVDSSIDIHTEYDLKEALEQMSCR